MNIKTKALILTSLMVLILIVFMGLTYTYFVALTTGDVSSNVIVQTADMKLLFTDTGNIMFDEALPGAYIKKTFEVENIGNSATFYNVRWKELTNEFVNDELTLTLECTAYDSSNKLIGSCGVLNDIVGTSIKGGIKSSIPIEVGVTHHYNLTITFIETGSNQNYNQGKTFIGSILIDTIDLKIATVRGILIDTDNNVLGNKLIEVHSEPTSALTNEYGEFLLEGLEYGEHELIVKDNDIEIARSDIVLEMTNNNSKITDSTSIYWNESQRNVVKIKIETKTNIINKIELDWGEVDARCFKYDSTSTSITDFYCYENNEYGLPIYIDFVIPRKVNGITLTSIGSSAFNDNNLINVVIPDSVTTIGARAFYNNKLTKIIIPDSVTSIGNSAFEANQLSRVIMSTKVKTIGNNAFENNKIISVDLPDTLTSIGNRAFYNNRLTSYDYPGGITIGGGVFNKNLIMLDDPIMYYKNKDGSYDKSTIIGCGLDGSSSVVIPNSVTNIKDHGLAGSSLKSVTISNSITSLGQYVFYDNYLTTVDIPDNVTSIGNYCFSNNQLTSIVIPNSVTSLGYSSFVDNKLESVVLSNKLNYLASNVFTSNKITKIDIPDGITSVGWGAFQGNLLTDVTIADSVTSIEPYAFYGNRISNLTLPDSITSIGSYAFYGSRLTSLVIPSKVTVINSSSFGGNLLESVVIPDGVTAINYNAFRNNKLVKLEIPNSVKTIGENAFAGNTTLTSIVIDNSINSISGSPWGANSNIISYLR